MRCGPGAASGVRPHQWQEGAKLHPPREQVRSRIPGESTDVACHVRGTTNAPVQHHARLLPEVLPVRIYVPRPDYSAEACHARTPRAVQRVVALSRILRPQRLELRDAPPMEGEEVSLALVIPPEVHSLVEVVCLLLAVPLPHGLLGEVQAAALRVAVVEVGRPGASGRRARHDVLLRAQHFQELAVSDAGLPQEAHADVKVPAVARKLLPWRRPQPRVPAEVLVVGLAIGCVRVVRLVGEPLEVHDNGVYRIPAIPEAGEGGLGVIRVLPSPARGRETEGVARRHPWPSHQVKVRHGALKQCRRRQ
mmetsp:Transcript_130796/g.364521  ORF Transcript_130796/g.364521 Transcript_130796/m.364521 type:complete len:307 (-) Transcript_130796:746-1666(-)